MKKKLTLLFILFNLLFNNIVNSSCSSNSFSTEPTQNDIEFYNTDYSIKKAEYIGKACVEYSKDMDLYYYEELESLITLFDETITKGPYKGAIKFLSTNNKSLATYSISDDRKMVAFLLDKENSSQTSTSPSSPSSSSSLDNNSKNTLNDSNSNSNSETLSSSSSNNKYNITKTPNNNNNSSSSLNDTSKSNILLPKLILIIILSIYQIIL